jgi:GPN-loop GTPase
MLHLTRAIDRATGYVFVPPPTSKAPPGTVDDTNAASATRANSYALFSSAAGPMRDPGSDVRDVQERWVDAKDEYDAYEKVRWKREGEIVSNETARKSTIRERQ